MTKRILYAEDDDFTRELVCDALREEGYEVVDFDDGLPAHHQLRIDHIKGKNRFDLVITDLQMPGVDGYSLLNDTMHLFGLDVPVIVTSGDKLLRDLIGYKGRIEYVSKEEDLIDNVLEKVREILD